MPCVWSQNLEIINLLQMLAYDIVPHGHLCYTFASHDILLFVNHPTYVKLNQNKEINYKVVGSKLNKIENMLKISQNLCKLVEMWLRLQVYTNYSHNCKTTKSRL
jgi:hypothetical protein